MAAMPASPVPTISPAEMQILISRSGLVLNPGQMADLVLAWRQVAGLIAAIPQGRPLADDLAYSFRLAPGTAAGIAAQHGSAAEAAARSPAGVVAKPAAGSAAKPAGRAAAKPAAKVAAKSGRKGVAKPSAKAAQPRTRGKLESRPKSKTKPKPQTARRRASSGR